MAKFDPPVGNNNVRAVVSRVDKTEKSIDRIEDRLDAINIIDQKEAGDIDRLFDFKDECRERGVRINERLSNIESFIWIRKP